MTDTSRETILKRVLFIWYSVQFCRKNDEDKNKDVKALMNLSSDIKIIQPVYAIKFGFYARKIDVVV